MAIPTKAVGSCAMGSLPWEQARVRAGGRAPRCTSSCNPVHRTGDHEAGDSPLAHAALSSDGDRKRMVFPLNPGKERPEPGLQLSAQYVHYRHSVPVRTAQGLGEGDHDDKFASRERIADERCSAKPVPRNPRPRTACCQCPKQLVLLIVGSSGSQRPL